MATAFQLPLDTVAGVPGTRATGFGTPRSDTAPQVLFVPPRRAIPIVFLPGIMGSNLVVTDDARIERLKRDPSGDESNIAWRPDNISPLNPYTPSVVSAAERQLLLDPATTAVDVYNPASRNSARDGDRRNANVALAPDFQSPLLSDDPPGKPGRRTAAQKARDRGWGEVFFKSYGTLLQRVESRMQRLFADGRLGPGWLTVIGADPARWGIDPSTPQQALTEADLRAITKDTFFPVHAVGYNWLADNGVSAKHVANAIRKIIDGYRNNPARGYDCPGVIVVTHSMGGLVGRALVHPKMGQAEGLVLGIVHGVQPAIGAAAGYTRMRAGFEDPGLVGGVEQIKASVAAKVAGNFGDEVTAVLASSPGGLQLLPSKAYGNGWLRVEHDGRELLRLPANGDPYEEIYKLRDKWYGLVPHESWVNPAGLSERKGGNTIEMTHDRLDVARGFHEGLGDHYHPHTYAHYGADPRHRAFGNVTWQIACSRPDIDGWNKWSIKQDSRQGSLWFARPPSSAHGSAGAGWVAMPPAVMARLDPPDEAGDQTVPMRSADHQLRAGKCKAVFRQTGYDHQGSYMNESVLEATLFSILKIAQTVQLP